MTGPVDPEATRPFGAPGTGPDVTQAAGPAGPAGGGPDDSGVYGDEQGRRRWWMFALGALAAGVLLGGLIALATSGDDEKPRASRTTTTSTSTTTTTSTTSPPTTAAPTTAALQPPAQVTGLTAGPGGGSGEVSLTWNPVVTAASYRIYRSSTSGTDGSLIATVNTTSYVDTPGSGSWYYQVSAVNGAGMEGPRSAEACGAPTGSSC